MAMLLKDRYNLNTLRVWIGYRESDAPNDRKDSGFSSERVVRTQLYQGTEAIGVPRDTSFQALGLTVTGYPPEKAWLPQIAETAIAEQLRAAADGDRKAAVWLHIKQDSYPLALLSWEEMASQVIDTPVLRIGNFVDDPYKPVREPRIAICASQPIADGPFALDSFAAGLVSSIEHAAALLQVSPHVSVFADFQWQAPLHARLAELGLHHVKLEIIDPRGAPLPTKDRASDATAQDNSWLGWMRNHFVGATVDIVHFVTPGWFAENHGAIALAESPIDNFGGGAFLGAAQLVAFYDSVGCCGMAFSSPDMPQWEWGQRMLAFELSWLRPGPVLVFEHGVQDDQSLWQAYALLLGAGADSIEALGYVQAPPQLTCHPQLVTKTVFAFPFSAYDLTVEAEPDPVPADLLTRQLEQAIAQLQPNRVLSMTEQWEATGATQALAFVKSLG